MQRMVWTFCALVVVVCVEDARAVDGVLEISQTCALAAGGCFPGDVAGYPVTIAQPGSYRLTSNLQVADANTTAIQVTGLNVTLDLGGFTISGPTVCGPGLPVTTCNPTGSGVGILGGGVVTVRNGTVTGMGSDGINLTYAGRVEEMRLISNGGDGIHAQDSAFVRDVETSANGGDGIDVGIEAVLRSNLSYGNRSYGLRVLGGNVIDSVSSRNGSGANFGQLVAFHGNQFTANTGDQVAGGKATGGNVCSDHTCTHTGARRFYLSRNTANGAQALSACASGFHMASIWELHEPSSLVYDTELGIVNDDSGAGPPTAAAGVAGQGWIRDGFQAFDNTNCLAWTSASSAHLGFAVYLDLVGATTSPPTGATAISPWLDISVSPARCDMSRPVWCIED